ncbi:hypothetical protein K493DRAFT_313351 [Basidiobolus meristosporus CBS 931.73]|uniref:BZIP domain-containing protein n=1 Tax=Basidiobolus meristosporus CBS 931.73 TaxID=1314790 RepID=A0A1Y1YM78_9FUNG|nr:hypothetical protein K493DRAFT_313351 [Basidiobolus meristosporus CBS 931.73]|eukprot:ORX99112.1 hypothetical protein K493DRAFT_313351 [Basidiobolus meristosporus CBS 931.73]
MPPATTSEVVFRKPSVIEKKPKTLPNNPDFSPLNQDFSGVPLIPPNSSPLFDSWVNEFHSNSAAPSPIGDFSLQSPIPGNLPSNGMNVMDAPLFDQQVLNSLHSPMGMGALNFFPDLNSNVAGNSDSMLNRQHSNSQDIMSFVSNHPTSNPHLYPIRVKAESNKLSNSPSSSPPSTKRRDSGDTSGDENSLDPVALKRKKNTDAARRSRMRKVQKMETLEKRVSDLEADNSKLQMKLAVLESEKTNAQSKEVEYSLRIKNLENQLAEAHRALTRR